MTDTIRTYADVIKAYQQPQQPLTAEDVGFTATEYGYVRVEAIDYVEDGWVYLASGARFHTDLPADDFMERITGFRQEGN